MMKLFTITCLIVLLYSCGLPDPEHAIKDSPDIQHFDSVLYTGWYVVADTATPYKRQLVKGGECYYLTKAPVVTADNIDDVSLFHEKDCWALITRLDDKGAQALNALRQDSNAHTLAFILDNRLLRVQAAKDPQFAKVNNKVDPKVYGEVLTLPCHLFSPEELKDFETILKSER